MATLLQLESFDAPGAMTPALAPPAEAEGYQDGYAAGAAATEAALKMTQDHLREELVAAVQAAGLTLQDVQKDLVASVTPLLNAILNQVMPATLAPALYENLRQLVTQALAADAQTQLTLRIAPEHLEPVRQVLRDIAEPPIQVCEDPSLNGAAAWVVTPRGETALDMDAALATIRTHLEALQTVPTSEANNG